MGGKRANENKDNMERTKTTNGWKSVKNRKDVGVGAEGVARGARVPGAADGV